MIAIAQVIEGAKSLSDEVEIEHQAHVVNEQYENLMRQHQADELRQSVKIEKMLHQSDESEIQRER